MIDDLDPIGRDLAEMIRRNGDGNRAAWLCCFALAAVLLTVFLGAYAVLLMAAS